MCGLVGVFGDLGVYEKKIFSTMLQLDVIRGKDSTGVFAVDRKGECELHKLPITPTDFLETSAAQRVITHSDTALFGHNRAATRGKVNRSNAHPFHHGAITMMHNGTLRSVYNLEKSAQFDTDSEAIAYNLSVIEPSEAPKLIEKLNGSFALIWHDARDNSVNIVRNSERPLHYMETVRGDVVYFSSELGILYASASREGFDIDSNPTKYIREVPEGLMFKLTKDGKKVKNTKIEVNVKKKTVGVGVGAKYTGTANKTPTPTGQNQSYPPTEKLWDMTGQKRNSWVEAYVSSWTKTGLPSTRNTLGTLVCSMAKDPYCKVILYGVPEPDEGTDSIDVKLSWISSTSHGNNKATSGYAVTINGSDWRYRVKEEKQDNVLSLPHKTSRVCECVNCGESIFEGDPYMEALGVGTVCGKCYYGDSEVRDLLSLHGLNESDMQYG